MVRVTIDPGNHELLGDHSYTRRKATVKEIEFAIDYLKSVMDEFNTKQTCIQDINVKEFTWEVR